MMRAISLKQPHASGMALGLKTIETRGRVCHVRGDLAIHASGTHYPVNSLPQVLRTTLWKEREHVIGYHSTFDDLINNLPYCAVVAVVELWMSWPTEHLSNLRQPLTLCELAWGDYSVGRWGWATRDLRRLKEPVPCKGHQGFFFLPADVEKKVRAQL